MSRRTVITSVVTCELCDRPARVRRLCDRHYSWLRRHDPIALFSRPTRRGVGSIVCTCPSPDPHSIGEPGEWRCTKCGRLL